MTGGSCLAPDQDIPKREGFALRLTVPLSSWERTERQATVPAANASGTQSALSALNFGINTLLAGDPAAAEEYFLKAAESNGPRTASERVAAAVANQAVALALLGRYAQARQLMQSALQRFRDLPAPAVPQMSAEQAAMVSAIERSVAQEHGALAASEVRRYYAPRLPPIEANFAGLGELRTLLNLANLDGHLGQLSQADQWLQQAQGLAGQLASRDGLSKVARWVASERAVLLRRAGRTGDASEQLRLANTGPAFDAFDIPLWGTRPLSLGAAGGPVPTQGKFPIAQGLQRHQSHSADAKADEDGNADLLRIEPSASADAALTRLQSVADDAERRSDVRDALAASQRMVMLASIAANPERERAALSQAARLQAKDGSLDAAIYLAKRSVNIAQQLRRELNGMERAPRQRYLADKRQSYTDLASWLMRRERLAEAELVLRLLKEDEGQQLPMVQNAGHPAERGRLPYSRAEQALLTQQTALLNELRGLCRGKQCGSIGLANADMQDLEALMRWHLASVSDFLPQLEEQTKNLGEHVPQEVRVAAGKKPASRTAAENELVRQAVFGRDAFVSGFEGAAAAVRLLRKQSQSFSQPLSSADARRVDELSARLEKLTARWRAAFSFLDGEASVPMAGGAADAWALLMSLGLPGVQQDWSTLRRLETLDMQRERLDAQIVGALADKRSPAEPDFVEADRVPLEAGRALLGTLPTGTVALYYLVGEQRLEVLMVTPQRRQAFVMPLGRAELEPMIRTLRQALGNPSRDPVAPARALYDAVLAPMEQALQEAHASTLMLSMDGALRYVPFAALHDASGWLAERYATSMYTTAAPGSLARAPAQHWRVAAFGSSAGGQGLSPLPAVRTELESVVRDARLNTRGVLPGTISIDRDFTAQSLKAALQSLDRQNVVHIASHFVFSGGDPAASFLLLGDGSKLTLTDLAQSDWRLDQVDLITLSACETALAGDDSFGQEVEGLGTVLQGQGAAAVLATLWPVADESTAAFMRALYALREQLSLTRAQALRDAQLRFIRGVSTAAADGTARGASRELQESAGTTGAFVADPARPHAHPYYWAPFVLMGNWL